MEDDFDDLRDQFYFGNDDEDIIDQCYRDNGTYQGNLYDNGQFYDTKQKDFYSYHDVFTSDNVFVGYMPTEKLKLFEKQNICKEFDNNNKKIILTMCNEEVDKIGRNLWGLVFETKLDNVCVFCGSDDYLCRMRVIPNKIIKYFPKDVRPKAENNIVICENCSYNFDKLVDKHIKLLSEKYNVDVKSMASRKGELLKKYKMAKRCLTGNVELTQRDINEKKSLDSYLRRIYSASKVTDEVIKKFVDDNTEIINNPDKPYKDLVSKVSDLKIFRKEWKDYIFSDMEPKYMSPDVKKYFDKY